MNLSKRRAVETLLAALALLAVASTASAQCAMCRTLLKTPEGQRLAQGLRSGILLLLAAPFSAFGVIASLAISARRKSVGGRVSDEQRSPG